jgi:hypothetical protein
MTEGKFGEKPIAWEVAAVDARADFDPTASDSPAKP